MPSISQGFIRLVLLCCALQCGAAHAEALTQADYAAEKKRIAAQSRAEQAKCTGAAKTQCVGDAKARERDALAKLETRKPVPPPRRAGDNSIRAGETAHVDSSGRVTRGKSMPVSREDMRAAADLRNSKVPSNQPVDVMKAARDAKSGKAQP